jgi:hypothetical protein
VTTKIACFVTVSTSLSEVTTTFSVEEHFTVEYTDLLTE